MSNPEENVETELLTIAPPSRAAQQEPQVVRFLIEYEGTSRVLTVNRGASVVVGRASPANLIIQDPLLSRRHAQLALDSTQVWVEDLRSRNGTFVNGRRVDRCQLNTGDRLTLGSVVISVELPEGALPNLTSYDQLRVAAEHEAARGREFRRPFSVMLVTSPVAGVTVWLPAIGSVLRKVDVVATNGLSSLLVLLPELSSSEAFHTAERILSQDREWSLRCAIAGAPEAGSSADELLEAALDLLPELSSKRIATTAHGAAAVARDLVIASPAMQRLHETVRRVALADIPVLIYGETGTGKELIARELHRASPRAKGPMRSVNCAAIPQTLVESTLFGHEKGAFTGATTTSPGVFEQSEGGTLFLDEIGELSLATQAALLRVLETKTMCRVGGRKEIEVDVRLVAATHRDIEAMAERGEFRSDLLYRLNAVTLKVPPLRERLEEIEPLARHFLDLGSRTHHVSMKDLERDAWDALKSYDWPGNVRELRNAINRALVVAQGDRITVRDLPERIQPQDAVAWSRAATLPGIPEAPVSTPASSSDFKTTVREYEIALMLDALQQTGGNKTQAAKRLKMPLRTFMHKWQAYELDQRFPGGFDSSPPSVRAETLPQMRPPSSQEPPTSRRGKSGDDDDDD